MACDSVLKSEGEMDQLELHTVHGRIAQLLDALESTETGLRELWKDAVADHAVEAARVRVAANFIRSAALALRPETIL
jgi:hypothetical protein